VGNTLNTAAPEMESNNVENKLQRMVVRLKTNPLLSFLREAIPEENPKNTKGIKTKPPNCTNRAVMVYISCWKTVESPNNRVVASAKAVAAR
jgi:hypothetical protein